MNTFNIQTNRKLTLASCNDYQFLYAKFRSTLKNKSLTKIQFSFNFSRLKYEINNEKKTIY